MDIRILHRGFHDLIVRKYGLTLRQRQQFPLLFHLMPSFGSGDSFHYLIVKRSHTTILPPLINRVVQFNLGLHLKFNLLFLKHNHHSPAAVPAGQHYPLYQNVIHGSILFGSPAAVTSTGKESAAAATPIAPLNISAISGDRNLQFLSYPRGETSLFPRSPVYHRQYHAHHTAENLRQFFNFFSYGHRGTREMILPPPPKVFEHQYRHLSFIPTITSFRRTVAEGARTVTEGTPAIRRTVATGSPRYKSVEPAHFVDRPPLDSKAAGGPPGGTTEVTGYDPVGFAADTTTVDTPVSLSRVYNTARDSHRAAAVLNFTTSRTRRSSVYFPLRLQWRNLSGISLSGKASSHYFSHRYRSSISRFIYLFPHRTGERVTAEPAFSVFSGSLPGTRSTALRQAGGSASSVQSLSGESIYAYHPARIDTRESAGIFISRIMERGSPPPYFRGAAGSDMSAGRTFYYDIRRRWQGWHRYHSGRPGEPGADGQVGLPGQPGASRILPGTPTIHHPLSRPAVSTISRSNVSRFLNISNATAVPVTLPAATAAAFEPGSREIDPSGRRHFDDMFRYAVFGPAVDPPSPGHSVPSSAAFPQLNHFAPPGFHRSGRVSRLEDTAGSTPPGMERRLTDRSTVEQASGPAVTSGSPVPPAVGLQQLTDRVYRLLEKRIKMERERRGW